MRGRRRWVVERLRIRPMTFGFGQIASGVAFRRPLSDPFRACSEWFLD